jgi:hypothetical protein
VNSAASLPSQGNEKRNQSMKPTAHCVASRDGKANSLTKAMQPMHTCEIRPRKDKRGFDLLRCAAVWLCGTASQTQSRLQSHTQSFAAAHIDVATNRAKPCLKNTTGNHYSGPIATLSKFHPGTGVENGSQ